MSSACPACRRRIVHGQVEGPDRRAQPDRAPVRQGLDHEARQERQVDGRRDDVHRLARPRYRARRRRPAARAAWWKSTGRNPPARPRWRCTPSPKRRSSAASAPSSMPSTRSIPVYARKLGVNVDDLLISQPDAGEQALEIADTLVRSGAIDVLVVDSVAALGAALRARRRDGRRAARLAGAADEPGAAQAHRLDLQVAHHGDFHQPDPHEDRRDVRLAGDDVGRAMR